MVHPLDLTTLKKSIKAFNKWRVITGNIKPDLSWANLRAADLRGANLSNADLSEAVLIMANLNNSDLTKANLTKADLSKVSFPPYIEKVCPNTFLLEILKGKVFLLVEFQVSRKKSPAVLNLYK